MVTAVGGTASRGRVPDPFGKPCRHDPARGQVGTAEQRHARR